MIYKKTGYTLLELLIVIVILAAIAGAFFSSITSSRRAFDNSEYAIDNQQDARKAVDRITWELRKSNPSWEIDGVFYNISINPNGDQMDFYVPIFDENNQITQLNAVRYYMNSVSPDQLLRKEGAEAVVITNNVDNVVAQKPFFSFNNAEHTIIDIRIPVIKNDISFVLTSQANLRNRAVPLDPEVVVAEIEEE